MVRFRATMSHTEGKEQSGNVCMSISPQNCRLDSKDRLITYQERDIYQMNE